MLKEVAANGECPDWPRARAEILEAVDARLAGALDAAPFVDPISGLASTVPELRQTLAECLDRFEQPPFTVQRLAELAVAPPDYASNAAYKYLHALIRTASVETPATMFEDLSSLLVRGRSAAVIRERIDWADDDANTSVQMEYAD